VGVRLFHPAVVTARWRLSDDSERYSALRQETPEWEIWVANQVAQLIEAGPHDPALLTKEQLSELLRIATDIVGLNKFARILGVSTTAVNEWQLGVQPTLCSICAWRV
jgi:hypothetical protein